MHARAEEETEQLDFDNRTPANIVTNNVSSVVTAPQTQEDQETQPQTQEDQENTALYKTIFRFLVKHGKLTPMDAAVLLQNFLRDPVWAFLSALKLNVNFEESENFWENTAAEILYTSIVVLSFIPLSALLLKKIYNIPFRDTLIDVTIASLACLAAIVPWNILQNLGQRFFLDLGFDEHQAVLLSAFFPGLVEPFVQASINNLGSYFFNASYRGTIGGFVAALLPYQVIPGDLWQLSFAATFGITNRFKRAVAATFAVGSVLPVANYISIKISSAISDAVNRCYPETTQISNNRRARFNRFFSQQLTNERNERNETNGTNPAPPRTAPTP